MQSDVVRRWLVLALSAAALPFVLGQDLVDDFFHGAHDDSFSNVFTEASSTATEWLAYADAEAQGLTGPIAIATNFELAEGIDVNQTCSTVGQTIPLAGYDEDAAGLYVCQEEDIVTDEKLSLVRQYIADMVDFTEGVVSVPKLWSSNDITLQEDDQGNPYPAGMTRPMLEQVRTTTYSGATDVVVVVSMRPHSAGPSSGIESYSSCLVRNQFRRCVVANINFCPAAIITEPASHETEAVAARGFAVSLHEMLHILNAVKPYGKFFINDDGSQPLDSDVCSQVDGVRMITTPSVLAIAQEQFSCASLEGVAVEDSRHGLGIHWEAELAGPEIMSVGDWTGETYMSDLTCAFLQDTGYYGCDFDNIGSLVDGTALEVALTENFFNYDHWNELIESFDDPFLSAEATVAAADEISRETTVTNRSVGYLRWGRNAGCDFVHGIATRSLDARRALNAQHGALRGRALVRAHAPNATLWEPYLCSEMFEDAASEEDDSGDFIEQVSEFFENIEIPVSSSQGYCTFDNRMTAACGASEVVGTPSVAQHCEPPQLDANSSSSESYWTCPENSSYPVYQSGDGTLLAGFNPALDYAPALVGFQSCVNINVTNGYSMTNGARATLDGDTIFGDMGGVTEGDGQAFCSNCRCMASSLVHTSEVLELNSERMGKCYITNCYHESYLQVGLVTSEGLTWYKCPDGGGDLIIPGYTGAITCPDPEDFCRQETITYIYMSETDVGLQWAFWIGMVLAGIIALAIIIGIWNCIEKPCRACCGLPPIDMYDLDGDGKADWKEYFAVHKKPCTSKVLIISNLVWVLVGLVCIACAIDIRYFGSVVYPGVHKHVAPFTGVGLGLLIYGILGMVVACEGRPNFKTLSYFYCTLVTCFAVAFFAVGVYFLADPIQTEVGKYWNEMRWYFPEEIQQANFSAAVDMAENFVSENFWIFGLVAIFIFLNLALSVVFAGCSIQSKVLVENFELVFNIGVGGISGTFVGFGIYYTEDLETPMVALLAVLLIPLLVIAVFGVIVFFCRNDKDAMKVYRLYIVYLVLVVFTLLLAVAFAAVLYLFADDFPAMVASNFTQEEILPVVSQWSSGDSWGYEELMVWGAGLMRLTGSAVMVIVIMLLFILGATVAILDFNKRRGDRSKIDNELSLQKHRTGPFWERVTYVFNYLDAFLNGLGDGIITVGELRSFFRGDDDLAEYFVTEIDAYARYRQDAWDLTAADDGQITLDEWYSFIDYLGDKHRKHAEEGLELFEQYMAADPKYDRVGRRKGPFWERCNAAFDAVDSGPVKGDGVLTFAELKRFFRGDETLSEYFITNIDQYSEQRTKDKDTDSDDDPDLESSALAVPRGDGVITLAEWYAFFDFLLGKNKLEALRGLAKFERFMKTTELAAQTFMEGSKTGRPLAVQRKGPVWRRINSLFDAIDAATVDDRDGDVTLTELKKFFTKTPELQQHYREKVDHRLAQRLQDDSVITLDEWYHYFETIAQQDPGCDDGDAATSLEVAQEITFLEKQAGMLAKPKVDSSKESSFSHGKVWNRIRKVFDLADAQLKGKNDGYRDNELSVSELRSLFKGDTRVADRYLEDIDEYSHEVTARDGYVSIEEWHDYFQGVANKDETCPSNDVESSVAVLKKLEVFERYIAMSSDSIEQKMNDKKSSSRKSKRKKTGAKRLSEHYDASESALLEAKLLVKTRKGGTTHATKASRLESKIKARQETKDAVKRKKSKKRKKKKKYQITPAR